MVEAQDLARLGVDGRFPAYEQQLAVLLPQAAHIQRVNSVLRNQAPKHAVMAAADLLAAYAAAYALMGNYCGGGEQRIREELMALAGRFSSTRAWCELVSIAADSHVRANRLSRAWGIS